MAEAFFHKILVCYTVNCYDNTTIVLAHCAHVCLELLPLIAEEEQGTAQGGDNVEGGELSHLYKADVCADLTGNS